MQQLLNGGILPELCSDHLKALDYSKTSDLDLTFKVKLAYKLEKYLFQTFKLTHLEFSYTLKLFIELSKYLIGVETGDLDHDFLS